MTATNEPFRPYTIQSLTEEERNPPEFIVDGMLPVGLTFLSGAPKTRKSFLALQLAASIANGVEFLGHKTLRSGVLYFDLEGSKKRIYSRAAKMTISVSEDVLISNEISKTLVNGLVNDLRDFHQKNPFFRVFIIDTFAKAKGTPKSGGANAYDVDVALLGPLQRMAINEDIAVLCVHHDKKGAGFVTDSFERLSGTMGISGSADAVWSLIADGKRFDGKATLEFTPRDAKGGELRLLFDDMTLEWLSSGNLDRDPLQNPVCRFLIENIPARQKEGVFYRYEDVYLSAYNRYSENPGPAIRAAIEPARQLLFSNHSIGVQLGVQSHGKRGLRIINLQ